MCYHLFLASPLTLSEVRSMLPPGLAADLVSPAELRQLRATHPEAQTGVRLSHGACACDLVTQRHPVNREDEALLRARYRKLGLSRAEIIHALENHRRLEGHPARSHEPGPAALARFVVEHARNAGESLYYLHFSHRGSLPDRPAEAPVHRCTAAQVRASPGAWLREDIPTMVLP